MDMSDVRIYEASDAAPRPALQSIARGFGGACPSCGLGRLFHRFLKVSDNCPECGEAFHHHQADDAPPYFTIMIVGHIVVPMMLWLELNHLPPLWVHAILWPALTLVLSLWFLPRLKGAIVGWQWALRMHGFGDEPEHDPRGL
ncbi:DUF983 domain-containing protein [Parvibaculum sp.]|jgi:uncharacterized protein (DUF983 family)|uniref:DUF983 domain-containing protein n=1 Tax=Parvibaculum sp. TaxID=2024848 RepID=UPI002FDB9199